MPRIKALLEDLLHPPLRPLGEVMDAHLDPSYRQRTDGCWSGREEVAAHFAHLRRVVAGVEVAVLDEVTDGTAYAERHVVRVTKRDGAVVVQEVAAFGALAGDGRLARIEELTLMLEGAEADRRIASASS